MAKIIIISQNTLNGHLVPLSNKSFVFSESSEASDSSLPSSDNLPVCFGLLSSSQLGLFPIQPT